MDEGVGTRLGLGCRVAVWCSYRKNCPAMIAPLHKQREGRPRKKPAGPYLGLGLGLGLG